MHLLGLFLALFLIATDGFSPIVPLLGQSSSHHLVPRAVARIVRTAGPSELRSSSVDINETNIINQDKKLTLPWGDFQDWALRDNIMKYVVSVPKAGSNEPELYALWRTMTGEHVELSGYPIDILMEKYGQQLKNNEDEPSQLPSVPGVLPLLDAYEFENLGLSGLVYGVPGIAPGTKIETTGLRDVQITVPKGYVLTEDASIAYELGSPARDFYSLDAKKTAASSALGNAVQAVGEASKEAISLPKTGEVDDLLVKLGASTAILLAGASAFGALSHHLTVNVFWV